MTKIKICGLKTEQDIDYVNLLRPDYIGFVFAQSKRQVTTCQAGNLKKMLKQEIPVVGVFVNAPLEQIVSLYRENIIDIIQLHGEEDAEYMSLLRQRLTEKAIVIRALRVKTMVQVLEASKMDCDYLLLDTYVDGQYGGSGTPFDRSLIPPLEKPFFLAGGLKADTVRNAIEECRPYGVDVSSGVETDGKKDFNKIKTLIHTVRYKI